MNMTTKMVTFIAFLFSAQAALAKTCEDYISGIEAALLIEQTALSQSSFDEHLKRFEYSAKTELQWLNRLSVLDANYLGDQCEDGVKRYKTLVKNDQDATDQLTPKQLKRRKLGASVNTPHEINYFRIRDLECNMTGRVWMNLVEQKSPLENDQVRNTFRILLSSIRELKKDFERFRNRCQTEANRETMQALLSDLDLTGKDVGSAVLGPVRSQSKN